MLTLKRMALCTVKQKLKNRKLLGFEKINITTGVIPSRFTVDMNFEWLNGADNTHVQKKINANVALELKVLFQDAETLSSDK